ncbi:hypothetical protein HYU19_02385 [Candidatus Woesearchaeota archaeon]|nr:hypothetical protein [Candidatus Woesearchaeota archaeon]
MSSRIHHTRHIPREQSFSYSELIMVVALLIILALLLQACQAGGLLRKGGGGKGPQPYKLHAGTEALSMSFVKGSFPSLVTAPSPSASSDGVPFSFTVEIENKGAADIPEGYMTLAVEKDYLNVVSWNTYEADMAPIAIGESGERAVFSLPGRTEVDPYGKQEFVTFTLKPLPIDPKTEQHVSTVILTACYKYQTTASSELCIDTDIYQRTDPKQKACAFKPLSFSSGQGGPVAVTSVDVKTVQDGDYLTPYFTITVKNVGKGQAVEKNKIESACSSTGYSSLTVADFNKVTLDEVAFSKYTFSSGAIRCDAPTVQLRDNEGKFRCHLRPNILLKDQSSFLTSLVVQLSYGYTQSISSPITIEKIT